MIRKIQINLSAEHPEIPLIEGATFVGSPSAVFVSGVPQAVGSWRITSVKVVATYPDDSAPTVECVKGADGVYVATIPATATSGRVTNGLQIIADGIDERGEAVTGYVLGIADFAVYLRDMTIEGATGVKYYLHLLDAPTDDPKEGDAYLDGSTLAIYHDGEWTEIAGGGYEPPPGGIPKTDLSAGVQASLDKADSALQNTGNQTLNGVLTIKTDDGGKLAFQNGNGQPTVTYSAYSIITHGPGRTWTLSLPANVSGTLALLSDILVKSVKLNGTALTPDSNGAVNVPALPLAGGTMTGELTARNNIIVGLKIGNDFDGFKVNGNGIAMMTSHAGGYNTFGEILAAVQEVPNKAPLASPAFTGTPTAPTPTAGDDSTKVATTAFVQGALPYAIASVPSGDALADRTVNTKTVNAATYAPSFPAETSGKSCDFYLAITSDTAGTVSAPSGKTLNNAKGESANLDYEANKTTVLRFTQIGTNTYVVTGGANGGGSVDPAQLAGKLDSEAAAPDYDSTATYAEGEYVTYLGKLYYAKQTIATAEDWTPAHWQEDRLAPYIKTFAAAITALSQRGYVIDDNGQPVAVFPDGTVPQIDGYPLRYSIPASVALTATNDEATLVLTDRAVTNATIATGFSTLNLTFPTAISGKVRDFYLRITVAAGESAPAMVLPQGITAETTDGSLPAIADGDASAASTTIVYFSETSAGTFIVKAEKVTTVASAA